MTPKLKTCLYFETSMNTVSETNGKEFLIINFDASYKVDEDLSTIESNMLLSKMIASLSGYAGDVVIEDQTVTLRCSMEESDYFSTIDQILERKDIIEKLVENSLRDHCIDQEILLTIQVVVFEPFTAMYREAC